MQMSRLGKTDLVVSRLCFGTLPMGKLQCQLPLSQGADLIRQALVGGVNFIDTAQAYGSYSYIAAAIKGYKESVIIATKTHANTRKQAEEHITTACRQLNRDYLDLVHLHAARNVNPFQEMAAVWEYLLECKAKGLIRYVGIATHVVAVVKKAATLVEVDVIHPLINKTGMGILGGNASEMLVAIALAHHHGKGIYSMKSLAGGNLIQEAATAFAYVLSQPVIDAVAVGMLNPAEVELNLALFRGEKISPTFWERTKKLPKKLQILRFCTGCGSCIAACPNEALALIDGKAVVDEKRCILCGYCAPACPEFYIRVV